MRDASGPSQRSCSTETRTPRSTHATAIWSSNSRGQRRPWTCTQEWSTAGRPGGMLTAAPSTPMQVDRRSLSNGLSMEPATPGRAAAPPGPSPIREDLTLPRRCSAFSLNIHIPHRALTAKRRMTNPSRSRGSRRESGGKNGRNLTRWRERLPLIGCGDSPVSVIPSIAFNRDRLLFGTFVRDLTYLACCQVEANE